MPVDRPHLADTRSAPHHAGRAPWPLRPTLGGFGRAALAGGGSAALLVLWAGAAGAHIDPDPPSVTAGTEVTVGFTVTHGCDGSPTVAMRFRIPQAITDAKGVAKSGWTVENGSGTVTFSGGELGPETEDHFDLSFTAPAGVSALDFPIVQECAEGRNEWIAVAQDGQPEPDSPAPRVQVVAGPDTPVTTGEQAAADSTTTGPATTSEPGTTEPGTSDTTATGSAADSATVTTVTVAADGDDGGRSRIVTLVIGLVGVAAVGTGAAMMVKRSP